VNDAIDVVPNDHLADRQCRRIRCERLPPLTATTLIVTTPAVIGVGELGFALVPPE
jgi:hypothetical protein